MGKITKVSPLAPEAFPNLPVIEGVTFAAALNHSIWRLNSGTP